MSQQKFQKYFLNLNGYDDGSLLEKIFSILGLIQTNLLEVHHVTLHKILSLMLIIEIHEKDDVPFILQNLDKINNIRVHLQPLQQGPLEACHHPYILTLLGRNLSPKILKSILSHLNKQNLQITSISPLDAEQVQVLEMKINSAKPLVRQNLMMELLNLRTSHQVDLALQPDDLFRRNKRLIFLDADKTFIQCEMINEISRLIGSEKEVQQITEQAMNGEIDFREALTQRVRTLKGVRLSDLERLILNIPFTPGVERLVQILKMLGYCIGIVSGGFSIVIDHIRERFELDYGFANTLEIKDGQLTGRILGDIIDGPMKAQLLREVSRTNNFSPEQVIAVGDGANDLEMLSEASLGIAFNANHFLRERASGSLSLPNLDALLYFIGVPRSDVKALQLL